MHSRFKFSVSNQMMHALIWVTHEVKCCIPILYFCVRITHVITLYSRGIMKMIRLFSLSSFSVSEARWVECVKKPCRAILWQNTYVTQSMQHPTEEPSDPGQESRGQWRKKPHDFNVSPKLNVNPGFVIKINAQKRGSAMMRSSSKSLWSWRYE